MESLGCWLHRFVLTVLIPQRYVEVAPRTLRSLKDHFRQLKSILFMHDVFASNSSLLFFLPCVISVFFFFFGGWVGAVLS